MKYEYLEHTADIRYKAYGKNKEEIFSNAALAMFKAMSDENIEQKIEHEISVEGDDLKRLLYEWLEELIVLMDTDSFFISYVKKITIQKKDKYYLHATIVGDNNIAVDNTNKYPTKTIVKAITYNQMQVTDEYAEVVVDI